MCDKWSDAGLGGEQVSKLLDDIAVLKDCGVTSGSILYSWMNRRVQPLQKLENPRYLYEGPTGPSRFSTDKLGGFEAFKRVCLVLNDVEKTPFLPKVLFNVGISYGH